MGSAGWFRVGVWWATIFGVSSCDAVDFLGGDVYEMTFAYEAGDNPGFVWEFLHQRAAEQCQDDRRLGTIRITIEGVPDPRPDDWSNVALTDKISCDDA